MYYSSESVEELIEQLCRLPTIGRKSAQRLAAHVLKMPRSDVKQLAEALVAVKDRVRACRICKNVTDADTCALCLSTRRDHGLVCVVEESSDVVALERTGEYNGVYHVLGGAVSPVDGIGPDDLTFGDLVNRVAPDPKNPEAPKIREVIVAVNPTVEGDVTAHYLREFLAPYVSVTRVAHGLPIGADLSFADEATLARALAGRRPL